MCRNFQLSSSCTGKLIPQTTTPGRGARRGWRRPRRGALLVRRDPAVDGAEEGFNLDPEKKSARLLFSSIGLLQPTLYIR